MYVRARVRSDPAPHSPEAPFLPRRPQLRGSPSGSEPPELTGGAGRRLRGEPRARNWKLRGPGGAGEGAARRGAAVCARPCALLAAGLRRRARGDAQGLAPRPLRAAPPLLPAPGSARPASSAAGPSGTPGPGRFPSDPAPREPQPRSRDGGRGTRSERVPHGAGNPDSIGCRPRAGTGAAYVPLP